MKPGSAARDDALDWDVAGGDDPDFAAAVDDELDTFTAADFSDEGFSDFGADAQGATDSFGYSDLADVGGRRALCAIERPGRRGRAPGAADHDRGVLRPAGNRKPADVDRKRPAPRQGDDDR